ncbi:MAG: hypothetical protein JWO26_24 [Rhodospirillales bacterium]|jgi:hypothetical protein|nr:hypothetical protein [Rhodospirillales bacterium]
MLRLVSAVPGTFTHPPRAGVGPFTRLSRGAIWAGRA